MGRYSGLAWIRTLPIYPFLASIYAVTALASVNALHSVRPRDLLVPLGVAVLVPAFTWVILVPLLRDIHRRAFFVGLVVFVFASYGYVETAIQAIGEPWRPTGPAVPAVIECTYVLMVAGLMFKMTLVGEGLTEYLNIVTMVLVAWSSTDFLLRVRRADQEYTDAYASASDIQPRAAKLSSGTEDLPDIYLIILDKYSASTDLRTTFGFDNSSFEKFLRSRGFVVPAAARPNYIHTFLSVTALLNFRYLDDLPSLLGPDSPGVSFPTALAENSRAIGFLRGFGYRFVFFPTAFPVSARNRNADVQMPNPDQITAEFVVSWLRSTLAEPILRWTCDHVWCSEIPAFISEPASLVNWKFERLKDLAHAPGPIFVVAHLPIPHEPYIFNADCTTRIPLWPPGFIPVDQTPEKRAYVAQVACLNKKLEDLVVHLQRESRRPPVILLQADHGHGRMVKILDLAHTSPDRVGERARLFAAYFLPGAPESVIPESITPVNVFRIVFDQYFHARLPLLPNRTYWSSAARPLRFTELH